MTALTQLLERGRVDYAGRVAARAMRQVFVPGPFVENDLRHDAAGGVSGTKEKDLMHSSVCLKPPLQAAQYHFRNA